MTDEHTGVVEESAAGAEEEFDLEALLFGDTEETGEEPEGDTDPEVEAEQGEVELPTEDASKAFAKKWSAEKSKIRDEVREEVMRELRQQTTTTPQEQERGAPQHRELSTEELEKMAQEFDTSPSVMRILHQQQMMINRQAEDAKRAAHMSRERSEYQGARKYAEEVAAQNPTMPQWDNDKIQDYRLQHYKQYGISLPWKEAYRMQIADAVMSGEVTRQAQQEVIQNIQKRDTASPKIKSQSTQRMTVDDLTKEQFEAMLEDAKAGKFKRS